MFFCSGGGAGEGGVHSEGDMCGKGEACMVKGDMYYKGEGCV